MKPNAIMISSFQGTLSYPIMFAEKGQYIEGHRKVNLLSTQPMKGLFSANL